MSNFETAINNIDRALRNEAGCASELDYAEQTSWILFLKYLDDTRPATIGDIKALLQSNAKI